MRLLLSLALLSIALAAKGKCFTEDELPPLQQPYTITFENQGWLSQSMTQRFIAILFNEKMGFNVTHIPGTSSGQFVGLAHQHEDPSMNSDVSGEVWPSGKEEAMEKYITEMGLIVDGGASGVLGRSGIYTPRYFVDAYPALVLDFWRAYQQRPVIDMLVPDGTTPDSRVLEDTSGAPYTENGRWWPTQCPRNATGQSQCAEFLHRNPFWDQAHVEQMIQTLGLEMMIVYDAAVEARVEEFYGQQRPFIMYHWTPDTLLAQFPMERVIFRPYSDRCYESHRVDATGSLDCDFKASNLKKVWWKGLEDVAPDAVSFLTKFQLSNPQVTEIMTEHVMLSREQPDLSAEELLDQATCTWIKKNRDVWERWISYTIGHRDCAPGFIYSELTLTCVPCPSGSYLHQGECALCPPGTVQPNPGQSECVPCLPGFFAKESGSRVCSKCAPESFASEAGSPQCQLCPEGSSNFVPQTICRDCDLVDTVDKFLPDNAAACTCQVGFYGSEGVCATCPEGASCCQCLDETDEAAQRSNDLLLGRPCEECSSGGDRPVPKAGYVLSVPGNIHGPYVDSSLTFSQEDISLALSRNQTVAELYNSRRSYVVLPCHLKQVCLGGPDSKCAFGYTGRRCGQCSSTHYKLGLECLECQDWHVFFVILTVVLVVGLVFLSLWLVLNHLRMSSVIIFINLLQVAAVTNLYDLKWPASVTLVMNICSLLNFNIELLALECYFGSPPYHNRIIIWLALPVIFAILYIGMSGLLYLYGLFLRRSSKSKSVIELIESQPGSHREAFFKELGPWAMLALHDDSRRSVCKGGYLVFIMAAYPAMVQKMLELMICKEQMDGTFSVAQVPFVDCYDDIWYSYVGLSVTGLIVFGLGIPIAFFFLIRKKRKNLHEPNNQLLLGALVESYVEGWEFWDCVDMARTFLFLIGPAMFNTAPRSSAVWGLCVIMGYLLCEVRQAPFRLGLINRIDMLSDLAIFFYLACGTAFYTFGIVEAATEQLTLEVLCNLYFVCCAVFLICVVIYDGRNVYQEHKVRQKVNIPAHAFKKIRRSSVAMARRMSRGSILAKIPELAAQILHEETPASPSDSEFRHHFDSAPTSPVSADGDADDTKRAFFNDVPTSPRSTDTLAAHKNSTGDRPTEAASASAVEMAQLTELVGSLMHRISQIEGGAGADVHSDAPSAAPAVTSEQEQDPSTPRVVV